MKIAAKIMIKTFVPSLVCVAGLACIVALTSPAVAEPRRQDKASGETYSIMNEEPVLRRAPSQTPGIVNPHPSPLKPQGRAPRVIEQPSVQRPASPSMPVPGVTGNTGQAMTPPRPPGQSFQDRAIKCLQSGGASGVGAGQIGAYTQSCVNQ